MSLRDDLDTDLQELVFDTDDWAVDAVYTPAGGPAYAVVAIFEESFVEADPDTQVAVQSVNPRARIPRALLQGSPGPGDTVTISGTVYDVREYQPASSQAHYLILHQR